MDPLNTDIPSIPVVVKPPSGYKSSEFWLSALASVLGILMAAGVIKPGTPWDKAIGLIITALSGMGYTAGRSMVKAAALKMCFVMALLSMAGGCSTLNQDPSLTPQQKVNGLKHDYELAVPWITLAIEAGVFHDPKVLDAIAFARKEARAFIDDALVKAKLGALDWQFYYDQAFAALGRYLQFKADGEVEAKRMGLDPHHLPTTRPARPVGTNWRPLCPKPFLSPCLA